MAYSSRRADQLTPTHSIEIMGSASIAPQDTPTPEKASGVFDFRSKGPLQSSDLPFLKNHTVLFPHTVSGLVDRYLFDAGLAAPQSRGVDVSTQTDDATGDITYLYDFDNSPPETIVERGVRAVGGDGPFRDLDPERMERRARNLAALALGEEGVFKLTKHRNDVEFDTVKVGEEEHFTDGMHPVTARIAQPLRLVYSSQAEGQGLDTSTLAPLNLGGSLAAGGA